VVIDLVAVLHRGAIHLGGHPAGVDQRVGGAPLVSQARSISFGVFRETRPLPPQTKMPNSRSSGRIPSLERPAGGGGHAAGMPIETEDAAERLEPEGIGKPAQQFVGPEVGRRSGLRSLAPSCVIRRKSPLRRITAVQRKTRRAGAHV